MAVKAVEAPAGGSARAAPQAEPVADAAAIRTDQHRTGSGSDEGDQELRVALESTGREEHRVSSKLARTFRGVDLRTCDSASAIRCQPSRGRAGHDAAARRLDPVLPRGQKRRDVRSEERRV